MKSDRSRTVSPFHSVEIKSSIAFSLEATVTHLPRFIGSVRISANNLFFLLIALLN